MNRSIWWTILGVASTGVAGIGVGYWLKARQVPCACKAKPLAEAGEGDNGNGSGANGKKG